jgi:pilus assembly protein Flp/PilA
MLTFFTTWLMTWLRRDEEGQDLIEYAVLVALIALIVIAAVTVLGPIVSGVYSQIAGELD